MPTISDHDTGTAADLNGQATLCQSGPRYSGLATLACATVDRNYLHSSSYSATFPTFMWGRCHCVL